MARSSSSTVGSFLATSFAACLLTGCAAALGPGFVVQQQQIRVNFSPAPRPVIQIAAEYRLQNTGNQPLDSLDIRLPGPRFRPQELQLFWDAALRATNHSPDNPRDTELRFAQLWKMGETHTLKISYEILSVPGSSDLIGFAPDAFYLPAESWTPQLPQARGVFGFGGVPPKKWAFLVSVPSGFLVHASGASEKRSRKDSADEYRFMQTAEDFNPFVVAGKYVESQQTLAHGQTVHIWAREQLDRAQLHASGESLSRTIVTYDTVFGGRAKSGVPLWIIECASPVGCISRQETGYSSLLYGRESSRSAEMISRDSVVVNPQTSGGSLEASAGPALAAGWLGYGQNPGFYEQQPPVSALPAFAAALAREASSGPAAGDEIIRRALDAVPDPATPASNADPAVTRAKSLLLFFALRDRVGVGVFQKALQHMLYARRARGFDVTDLIAALEEESHQPVGPFVRQWIKHPGVPGEFRSRHSSAASQESLLQETTR